LQTSQGYIIRILQHFATKLWNITNSVMLFQVVMKFLFRSKFSLLRKWSIKVAPYSLLKSGKFMSCIKIVSGLLLVRKQKLCDLYKTIFLELEMINKNDVIVVAIAKMTFQHGRHFGFKRKLFEKTSGYPHFLFTHGKICCDI
jgi:hypothetical protein